MKLVKHMKLLGIAMHKRRRWTEHINVIKLHFATLHSNRGKLTYKSLSIKPNKLEIRYHTIVERIIFYDVRV